MCRYKGQTPDQVGLSKGLGGDNIGVFTFFMIHMIDRNRLRKILRNKVFEFITEVDSIDSPKSFSE